MVRKKAKILLLLACLPLANCSGGREDQAGVPGHPLPRDLGTGLIVVANPLSCGLTGAEFNRLNEIHADGRIKVRMALIGSETDSLAVAEMTERMSLSMPSVELSVDEYEELVGSQRLRPPVFLLVKQGAPVMTIANTEPALALDAVEVFYSR